MLTKLRAKNFKSWKDTGELELAPLTGLFGSNSSGKTSILQMLLMLKQTVESPDRRRVLHTGDERSLVDLGTYFDLIHGHQENASLDFSYSWNVVKPIVIYDPEQLNKELFSISDFTFKYKIIGEGGRAVVDSFLYEFERYKFGMKRLPGNEIGNAIKDQYELVHDNYNAKKIRGRAWPLPPPVKCYGFPDEATGYYQNTGFLSDFVLSFEESFSNMTYLGPLREYPKRSYLWAGERPLDVGRRGEQAMAALLAARAEKIKIGRLVKKQRRYEPLEDRILEWMREMNLIYSFSLDPVAKHRKEYECRVKKTATSSEVLITDVGFGVSQILPVLVLCYYVPEHSTILLEQPEIHLHPSVQAWLADVLIDVVNERNVQIIVESHSEHFIRRLQRRIAEEKIAPDKTALYFCRVENGESRIERLQIDLFGNILNWPEQFFGDELGDLAEKTRATMRRQGIID